LRGSQCQSIKACGHSSLRVADGGTMTAVSIRRIPIGRSVACGVVRRRRHCVNAYYAFVAGGRHSKVSVPVNERMKRER
jgi:hypothetical protein